MNKTEQVATINAAAIILENVLKHLTKEQAAAIQQAINTLDNICDNIKRI